MAKRKKGKEPAASEAPAAEPQAEQAEGDTDREASPTDEEQTLGEGPVEEPTQVDAAIPPSEDAGAPDQAEGEGDGATVDRPLSGDTEKLYTDRPPVPDEEPPAAAAPEDDQPLATVTDITSAIEATEETPGEATGEAIDPGRLEAIVESLLFASDKPLALGDLKRLLGERDTKKIAAAVEALTARRAGSGIHVTSAAGGWQLRTNPEHAPWVGKLLAGKPVRLSRAMLETMAIVAYRQPVTRPEIDDIRGVDCGPVLKTLLDRGLIRIIGKKEDVGRPMLYGTTPEFLRTFNLRDLTELPTLREFHELGAEEKAKVDAEHGVPAGAPEAGGPGDLAAAAQSVFTPHPPLAPDPDEDDGLIDDLERAAQAAARASGAAEPPPEKVS
jgi:segregation and condensation protein B